MLKTFTAAAKRAAQTTWFAPLALFLLALAVRMWRIGAESLWLDEATSLFLARKPVPEVIAWTAKDIHPPLYYLLLHFWRVFGESEAALRSLSAVAGALSVVVLYALGARLFDRRTGLVAGALLALAPIHVWYSQQARMYTWLGFWALLSCLCLAAYLDSRKARFAIGYVLASAAALYTHYYTVFVFLAQGVYVLYEAWRVRRWQHVAEFAAGVLASVALFAPWIPTMWFQVTSGGGGWVARGGTPGLRALADLLVGFSVGSVRALYPVWLRWLAYVLLAGLSLWAVWTAIRARDAGRGRGVFFAAAYFVVPVGTAWLVSQVKPLFSDRYLVTFLPGYLLLASAGIRALPGAWLRRGAVALLVVALAFGLGQMGSILQTEDWRSVAAYVSERAADGDVAVFYPGWNAKPFGYYATANLPAWAWFKVPLPPDEVASSVQPGLEGHRRAWLVWSVGHYGDPRGLVKRYMDEHYTLVDEQQFRGPIGVALYTLTAK
ncbi:MAG: glycosyltransferase family 39 protein [Anaerolineae bacterium]|jgi:4-amino-4-deoxy-L-arabinose transferase-like glycosyltransferase|nr:glycosyltransferase family 39 protein [Anaerolineae bacterium]